MHPLATIVVTIFKLYYTHLHKYISVKKENQTKNVKKKTYVNLASLSRQGTLISMIYSLVKRKEFKLSRGTRDMI